MVSGARRTSVKAPKGRKMRTEGDADADTSFASRDAPPIHNRAHATRSAHTNSCPLLCSTRARARRGTRRWAGEAVENVNPTRTATPTRAHRLVARRRITNKCDASATRVCKNKSLSALHSSVKIFLFVFDIDALVTPRPAARHAATGSATSIAPTRLKLGARTAERAAMRLASERFASDSRMGARTLRHVVNGGNFSEIEANV